MFDVIGGLPMHPLVVHAVVVLGPLAALGAVVYVLVPKWRPALQWPVLGFAVIAAASAVAAEESGEALQDRLAGTGFTSAAIETHAEAGELAAKSLLLLLGVVVVVGWLLRRGHPTKQRLLDIGALVVVLAAAGFVAYATITAGHSGATAVWGNLVKKT